METIAYATVINANRPVLWPCHEHYSDKQVSLKARHSSHCEVPYEKNNSCSKLHRQLRDDILDLRGMHPFLASCSERCCVARTSDSSRKTWNQRADISQVQYEQETTKQLTGNGRIISSLLLRWLHKLYALQRVLHYRVNLYANEQLVKHRLAWHISTCISFDSSYA